MEGWRGHGQTRRSNCGLGTMEKGALWDSSEKALASMGSGRASHGGGWGEGQLWRPKGGGTCQRRCCSWSRGSPLGHL